MISKKGRISQALFKKILINKGFFVQSPLFGLRVVSIGEKVLRIACVVSKKEAKTAVLRNKMRRRTYGAIRIFEKRLVSGHAVIFSLKKELATASPKELQEEIEKSLKKARILS